MLHKLNYALQINILPTDSFGLAVYMVVRMMQRDLDSFVMPLLNFYTSMDFIL